MKKYAVKKNTKKKNYTKFLIVIAFILAIIIVLHFAYNYLRDDIKDRTNLVINNINATNSLKNDIYIENGAIYISEEDISNILDFDIYYDEKYDQIITSSYNKLAAMPVGEKQIEVNSSKATIKASVINKQNNYYIPFSELEDVYNVKVKYSDITNIVTVDYLNVDYCIATATKKADVKYKPSTFSRTVAKVPKGNIYIIANNEDSTKKGWIRVRTEDGILGYVKSNCIGQINTIREAIEENNNENRLTENAWSYSLKSSTIRDYKLREESINKIVTYLVENQLDCVNIKFDNKENYKDYFSNFLIELKPRLNEIGATFVVNL